ncbi:hypothetical protein [Massilia sp. CCM 8734]|uniref:hypothetical protein n=1 Tax=Massilia sp. CCM 8734 TaxID=2609283 RepID=UPI0014248C79|nr:hypothetical protein [Massilia sp. CCM 8734]NHZ94618.1 hypothetical protein [Massilia sp. CCM 8734]
MDFLAFQVRSALIGNYKPERLFERGVEYGELVIKNAIEDVRKTGSLTISKWESNSGIAVEFKVDGSSLLLVEE